MNNRFKKFRKIVFKRFKQYLLLLPENPVALTFLVFVGLAVFTVIHSWEFYKHEEFAMNLSVELHGVLIDILVIGILIYWLNDFADRRKSIKSHLQEIDDFRYWKSEESIFRTVGNIKRLNKLKVYKLNLSFCQLENANLNYCKLNQSNLNYCNLTGAELNEVKMKKAKLNQVRFNKSKINSSDFSESLVGGSTFDDCSILKSSFLNSSLIVASFQNCRILEVDFQGADLHGANFKDAVIYKSNFSDCKGLSSSQIFMAKEFKECVFPEQVANAILMRNMEKNEQLR